MIQACILDLDGTLLDSMDVWDGLASDYIIAKGKRPKESRESLTKRFAMYTIKESANYLKERYDLKETIDVIMQEFHMLISDKYAHDVQLKAGVTAFLDLCKQKQIKLCVVTASDYENACAALKNNQVMDRFAFVMSGEDYGLSKRNPEIFINAWKRLDVKKENCIVIEDALHAMEGAKKADFQVYGVYDEHAKDEWTQIIEVCDRTFSNFIEVKEYICKPY